METQYGIIIPFIIGASVSYYLLNAIFLWRTETYRLQRILAAVFVFTAITTGKDLLLVVPGGYTKENLDYVLLVDGWSAIAYAVFLFELTSLGWTTGLKLLLLSLPFAVFTWMYAYLREDWVLTAYTWFLCVFGIVVLLEGCKRVYKYMKYVRSEYSNLDNINLSWFWNILTVFFFTQLLWLVCSKAPSQIGDILYYVVSIVFWEITLSHCRKLRPVLVPKEIENIDNNVEVQTFPFEEKFKRMIEEEKVYKERDLRLEDLAKRLNTNRTYLGLYFRNVLHTTFYDYINHLRIEEIAIPMMKEHPEYKLEHIATESGFNSISTFRRAFRKITRQLPHEYQGC